MFLILALCFLTVLVAFASPDRTTRVRGLPDIHSHRPVVVKLKPGSSGRAPTWRSERRETRYDILSGEIIPDTCDGDAVYHDETLPGTTKSWCVSHHVDRVMWHEATNLCKSTGGTLVIPFNENMNNFVQAYRTAAGDLGTGFHTLGDVWIDFTDEGHEGIWLSPHWQQEANGYTNWDSGQPDNCCHGEHWASLWKGLSGKWNDWYPIRHGVVCQKPMNGSCAHIPDLIGHQAVPIVEGWLENGVLTFRVSLQKKAFRDVIVGPWDPSNYYSGILNSCVTPIPHGSNDGLPWIHVKSSHCSEVFEAEVSLEDWLKWNSVTTTIEGTTLHAQMDLYIWQFDRTTCSDITEWMVEIPVEFEIQAKLIVGSISAIEAEPVVVSQHIVERISKTDLRLRVALNLDVEDGFTLGRDATIETHSGSEKFVMHLGPRMVVGSEGRYRMEVLSDRELTGYDGRYTIRVELLHSSHDTVYSLPIEFSLQHDDGIFSGDLGGNLEIEADVVDQNGAPLEKLEFPQTAKIRISDPITLRLDGAKMWPTTVVIGCFEIGEMKKSDLVNGIIPHQNQAAYYQPLVLNGVAVDSDLGPALPTTWPDTAETALEFRAPYLPRSLDCFIEVWAGYSLLRRGAADAEVEESFGGRLTKLKGIAGDGRNGVVGDPASDSGNGASDAGMTAVWIALTSVFGIAACVIGLVLIGTCVVIWKRYRRRTNVVFLEPNVTQEMPERAFDRIGARQ